MHEARMAALRAENAQLTAIVVEQDIVLAEMADRTREIEQTTAQRQQELDLLRAAREQREKEAKEATESDVRKDKQGGEQNKKDNDPDVGGPSTLPVAEPTK